MEKLANRSAKKLLLKTYIQSLLIAVSFIFTGQVVAQQSDFSRGKTYILEDVTITGNTNFSPATIVSFSRLKKGEEIVIPGEDIAKAIKKLWDSNLFSSIDVYLAKVEGDKAYLEINLYDLPELRNVTIEGIKKGKHEAIIKDNGLNKGVKVTENLVTTTKNYLTNKYKKQGFLKTKVGVNTREVTDDSIEKARVDMLVYIDRGKKVKIKSIDFAGNEKLSDKKLRKALKNTKKKMPLRFWKRSKYIKADYKEDLVNLIDTYKENGYRDARILSDSITFIDDETIALNIEVEEGEQYKFGKIEFVGNSVYTDQQLRSVLRIKEGSTYNGVELRQRIADETKPDAVDLTNLYQDSGYLFSSINAVEVSAEGNVIDLEIRINEGKPAYFNQVSVSGNDKTNDRVIYRELRTKPGQLYKKSNVIRTIRQLGQLGFFDAQQLTPDMKNFNTQDGTVDIDYQVVERGSSQIELQGGYGGGGFIGTLGLSFNNFAIKDLFNKEAYTPIPAGDGQSLALRLQASRFFRTYSFSFSEPWLGGRRPVQLSTSLSHTQQFLFDPVTRDADRNRRFNITGISVGLAKRLKVPDDYFQLSQAVAFQHYNLKNYNTGLFTFGDGFSNNLSYTIGLTRNNTATDPIYPTQGSNFAISAKFSLPYSLFNGVDYESLREERDQLTNADPRAAEIDQEFFRWLEFYKIKFAGDWFTNPFDKVVLRSAMEFGFLGAYNQDRGVIPFERFFLGGDGLGNFALDGREIIQLRGYPNQSLSNVDGGTIYNKFSLELRYPVTLGAQAKIYVLTFAEAGASYDNFRDFNPFNLQRSAGAGVRIFMPAFGLLGIDFGYGFDPIPGTGTNRANGLETHFIIGQQF
ncbi:MAG: outer membrane protein assembly factor BamA [Bacteroidota bacterium]